LCSYFIDPTRDQFGQFAKMPLEGRIHMLNLVKLKAKAIYEDGREATGAEAYKTYGKESAPFFQGVGGTIAWRGKPHFMLIGPQDESWDIGFLAEYPSKDAILAMIGNPGYQAIVHHRQAAVETSRLVCFQPLEGEALFG